MISFSVRFDLSSFYSRFTSKQCHVCLYFQSTTHIHIQLAVARLEIVTLKQFKNNWQIPLTLFSWCVFNPSSTQNRNEKQSKFFDARGRTPKVNQSLRRSSWRQKNEDDRQQKERTTVFETYTIRSRLLKQKYKFSDSSVFWLIALFPPTSFESQ